MTLFLAMKSPFTEIVTNKGIYGLLRKRYTHNYNLIFHVKYWYRYADAILFLNIVAFEELIGHYSKKDERFSSVANIC